MRAFGRICVTALAVMLIRLGGGDSVPFWVDIIAILIGLLMIRATVLDEEGAQ